MQAFQAKGSVWAREELGPSREMDILEAGA